MSVFRSFRAWRAKWRRRAHLWGPLGVIVIPLWMIASALFWLLRGSARVAIPSKARAGQAGRRKHPPGYHKARAEAIERNIAYYGTQTCEVCYRNRSHGVEAFEVHHVKSWKRHPELRADPDNLAVACFSCNRGMSDDYQSIDLRRCERKAS